MRVARAVGELPAEPRAVAVGSFDGVHVGHRRVLEAVAAAGLVPTVVTFEVDLRAAGAARGERRLLTTLCRRLELLEAAGVEDVLVLGGSERAAPEPKRFAEDVLRPIGAEVVVVAAGANLPGHGRPESEGLERLGVELRRVPLVEGVSSALIRDLVAAGELERAARLLGRPVEVEGVVVAGDRRGRLLGYPTANLAVDPALVLPPNGIYAAAVGRTRAAVSVGTNPHFGGREHRIEAFLLDFEGDLYGQRLVVELWKRLRDERAFASEAELVEQIARDVEETRQAVRPL